MAINLQRRRLRNTCAQQKERRRKKTCCFFAPPTRRSSVLIFAPDYLFLHLFVRRPPPLTLGSPSTETLPLLLPLTLPPLPPPGCLTCPTPAMRTSRTPLAPHDCGRVLLRVLRRKQPSRRRRHLTCNFTCSPGILNVSLLLSRFPRSLSSARLITTFKKEFH